MNKTKIQWKLLILFVLIPLAVGAISGFLSKNGMQSFESVNKPPLSPPATLFPIVWTILYTLMGIASYLVFTSSAPQNEVGTALRAYTVQLVFNFFWSPIFFNLQSYLLAFIWLVLLLISIIITCILFFRISKPAGYLLIPYIIWVSFAGYLNLAIYFLNR